MKWTIIVWERENGKVYWDRRDWSDIPAKFLPGKTLDHHFMLAMQSADKLQQPGDGLPYTTQQ